MKKLFRNFCATAIAGLMILSGAACSKDGGGEVDGKHGKTYLSRFCGNARG